MNERIRELEKQATEEVMKKTPSFLVTNEMWKAKFAELIVRECCEVLQNEDIQHSGYGYNQGFLHKKIKQHFGVKE